MKPPLGRYNEDELLPISALQHLIFSVLAEPPSSIWKEVERQRVHR